MQSHPPNRTNAERDRLNAEARRLANWKRWGPYLSERQWGTVREDYSEHGNCWDYFPHDHARSRAGAGPRLCTVTRIRMSSGAALAYSTNTSK